MLVTYKSMVTISIRRVQHTLRMDIVSIHPPNGYSAMFYFFGCSSNQWRHNITLCKTPILNNCVANITFLSLCHNNSNSAILPKVEFGYSMQHVHQISIEWKEVGIGTPRCDPKFEAEWWGMRNVTKKSITMSTIDYLKPSNHPKKHVCFWAYHLTSQNLDFSFRSLYPLSFLSVTVDVISMST